MIVSVAGTAESSAGRRTAFYDDLVASVEAMPGVSRASFVNHLPLGGDVWTLPVDLEGRPEPAPGDEVSAAYRVVYPGYFETMDLDVRRGRGIEAGDRAEALAVVVVNAHMADAVWPGEDPLGKRLMVAGSEWATVVGVVENAFAYDWAAPPANELYLPYRQSPSYREDPVEHMSYLTLVVQADGDPAALEAPVRRLVRDRAPDVTVSAVLPMRDVVAGATSGARFLMALLAAFAGIALVLAAVGVYGVTSYDVAGRRREIGIRLAMGAAPRQVLWQVVRRGMGVVLAGMAIGLLGAYAVSGLLAGALFGIEPTDPLVFGVVPAVLGAVALVASVIPSWRAARVSPMAALGE
jgi:predicted permease